MQAQLTNAFVKGAESATEDVELRIRPSGVNPRRSGTGSKEARSKD